MFDLSSNTCVHLRITASKEICIKVLDDIHRTWPGIQAMITGFEVSKEGVAHCHSHIEFIQAKYDYHMMDKGKTYRSAAFKKLDLVGMYNFQKLDTTPIQNIQYCIKDDDIIYKFNVCETQLEEIKNNVQKIQKEMKLTQRDRLLEAFREQFKSIPKLITRKNCLDEDEVVRNDDRPHRLYEIAEWIHNYYVYKLNLPPPTMHMKEYVLWMATKEEVFDGKDYYAKMFSFQ